MHEILRSLSPAAFLLDLGSSRGSFAPSATSATTVRVDRDVPLKRQGGLFVQADAARLPFRSGAFAVVVANHSLEHFDDLIGSLREIGRVLDPQGALFVSVPDASTVTDKLYRWLSRGGGHVNAFTSCSDLVDLIERYAGCRHVATRLLYSSLSFLNRRNAPAPLPLRLLLLGAGYEWSLFLYAWLSRLLDRIAGTRTSVYGWALYFGSVPEGIDLEGWTNVCIRCGSGHAISALRSGGLIRSTFSIFWLYQCPACGAVNPFTRWPGLRQKELETVHQHLT